MELSPSGRNAYRELCDEVFAEGSIPDDPVQCALIAGLTEAQMSEVWDELRPWFFRLRPGRLGQRQAIVTRAFVLQNLAEKRTRAKHAATVRWSSDVAETSPKDRQNVAEIQGSRKKHETHNNNTIIDLPCTRNAQAMLEDGYARSKDSVSSSGVEVVVEEKTFSPEAFPDPEVFASVQTRVPVAPAKISAGVARKVSAGGNGEAAPSEACKVQVWDRYPGVKTEDDFRMVLSLCDSVEQLDRMVASLVGWIASGRWTDLRYVPRMHTWLCGDAKGHGPECWIVPPKIPPAKTYGSSEDEAMRQAAANLPKLGL